MAHNWDSSTRRQDPPHWPQLKTLVKQRAGGFCQHMTEGDLLEPEPKRCHYPGTEVDHIINLASGGTDDPANLQLLCTWHHKQKTAQEAAAKRKPRTERHPREQHPGFRS